jgi:hypothetical protein
MEYERGIADTLFYDFMHFVAGAAIADAGGGIENIPKGSEVVVHLPATVSAGEFL